MRILFIALIALSINACTQKKNITSANSSDSTVSTETVTAVEETKDMDNEKYDNDCFRGRAITKEVSGQEATMVKAVNMFMFSFENTRWQPCSVPVEYQMEGLKVKVSGEVLEIKPNERRAGTPFNITSLEKS